MGRWGYLICAVCGVDECGNEFAGGMSPRWTSGVLALSPLVPPISIACANDSSLMEIHACACSNVPRITARSRSL